jgi:hypothetical protein
MVRAAAGRASVRPGLWSLLAFGLAGAAVVAATWFIAASDDDVADWIWAPLLAPVVITLVPVLVPRRRGVFAGALVAMTVALMLSGWVLPVYFLPAFFALVVAAIRETA